jgi:hypothetical protein
VICVGRPAVAWRVQWLLEPLRQASCAVTWLPLEADDVPSAVNWLAQRLPGQGSDHLVFDLTNALGLVGLALYEVARRWEQRQPERCRLVRIDWSDRVVRSISPDRTESTRLEVRLSLADFLALHGKRLVGVERARGSSGRFGQAAHRLARDQVLAEPLLAAVHHGAWDRPLRVRGRQLPELGRLIDELAADGLLVRDGGALYASDLRAFQYLHGRWLEEYLFEIAEASGRFDDCASGLRFVWLEEPLEETFDGPGNGPDLANEIDFAGTVDGRATIASCKTGFREAAAPLYELLTLAERAAGRSVVTVFATTRRLDRVDRHRASALGIQVLDGERLADERSVLAALLGAER